jgi:hypothetical protein
LQDLSPKTRYEITEVFVRILDLETRSLSFDLAQDGEDIRLSGSTVLSGSPSKDSVEALVEPGLEIR